MASPKQTREPSWLDVMAWVRRVEDDHNVTITIVQSLRPTPGKTYDQAAVVVCATARNGIGTGAERVVRTGSFPTAGARSMTALLLNLLFQVDNRLSWQEADAMDQQEIV